MSPVRVVGRACVATLTVAVLLASGAFVGTAAALETASSSPAAGQTVTPPATVRVSHDAALNENPALSNITVSDKDDAAIPGSTSFADTGKTIVFTPTAAPATAFAQAKSPFSVTVNATAASVSVPPSATTEFSFSVDTTGPAVTSRVPAAGASVTPPATVSATFNEALDSTQSTITVTNGFGNGVSGARSFHDAGATIRFTPGAALPQAGSPYAVVINAKDALGNASTTSYSFAVDSTTPLAPTVVLADPITGSNVGVAPVNGTAESGTSVTISVDDTSSGSAAVTTTVPASSGTYATTMNLSSLADGVLTATVTATDAAGNGSPSASDTATKETSPPGAPTVSHSPAALNAAVQELTVSGVAEPGSTVAIAVANTTGSPVTASAPAHATTGAYSATLDVTPLADGILAISAVATDTYGNAGPAGTDSVPNDTALPGAPTAQLAAPVNATTSSARDVSGTAEAGSTVHVTVSDGSEATPDVVQEAPAHASTGAYSVALDLSGLADGPLSVSVTARDAAGNTGPAGTTTGTKDVVAPTAGTVTLPDFVNAAGKAAVAVSGTGESGATAVVTITSAGGGSDSFTAPITGGGWSATRDLTGLGDGTITAALVVRDTALNEGPSASDSATKDVVLPAAPTVTLTDPITDANAGTATVSGAAEPGATVQVSVDDTSAATAPRTASVTATEGYSVTPGLASLVDGVLTATVSVRDPAGNTGPAASDTATKDATTLDVVSSAPAHNSTVKPPATVSVTFNEPVRTSDASITLADASTLALSGSTSFADGNRTIVFTPTAPLSDSGSPYSVAVSAKDADGTDSIVAGVVFTVDGTAPAAPTAAFSAAVDPSNVTAAALSGTAESGALINVSVDDAGNSATAPRVATTTAATGVGPQAWSLTVDVSTLDDGTLTATVTAADSAGNVSTPTTTTTTKDVGAPVVSSVSRSSVSRGRTGLGITVTGTHFRPGATVAFGPGVTVASQSLSGSTISAVIDVAGDAALGERTVTVTNTDGTAGDAVEKLMVTTARRFTSPPRRATSGSVLSFTVTARTTSALDAPVDTTYGGTPTLTLSDTHGGATCAPAEAGVASCTATLGDLGTVTGTSAGSGSDADITGQLGFLVQPTALTLSGPTQGTIGQGLAYTVTPVAGVSGADITGYIAPRRLVRVAGGSTSPANGSTLACGGGACGFSVTFGSGGVTQIAVEDNSVPAVRSGTLDVLIARPTTLGITRSAAAVTEGSPVTLAGRLLTNGSGAPVAGATIRIQAKTATASSFSAYTSALTDEQGRWTHTFSPLYSRTYRAVFAGTANHAAATSAAMAIPVRIRLTVTSPASGSTVPTGTSVRGTAATRHAGVALTLQRRLTDGSWSSVRAGTLGTDGKFALAANLLTGSYTLRVISAATAANAAGESASFSIQIS